MACASYLCPGDFAVYRNIADIADDEPEALTGAWVRVPEVLSWSLEPSTDSPTGFRTADTAGTRVKVCLPGTEWTVTVTTKLCIADWLYDDILDPADKTVGGWYSGSSTLNAWWYLSFDNSPPSATPAPTDQGIFLRGTPTPPGVSGDNDSDEAAGAEFTIEVAHGPFFPDL